MKIYSVKSTSKTGMKIPKVSAVLPNKIRYALWIGGFAFSAYEAVQLYKTYKGLKVQVERLTK